MARASGQYAKGARGAKVAARAHALASALEQVEAMKRTVDQLRQENSTLKDNSEAARAAWKSTVDQMQQENRALKVKCEEASSAWSCKVDQLLRENHALKAKCEALPQLRNDLDALQLQYAALVAKRVASVPLSWSL